MLKLGVISNFKFKIIEWYNNVFPMKDPVNFQEKIRKQARDARGGNEYLIF